MRRFDEKPPAAVVCHLEGMDGWRRFDESLRRRLFAIWRGGMDGGDLMAGMRNKNFSEFLDETRETKNQGLISTSWWSSFEI